MKRPWKDMEFTEEELRDIERAGRAPRSPKAHQPDVGPRGWLAPPPSTGDGKGARRRVLEELDQVVESAFSAVEDAPTGAVQWLDANVLVTDHGVDDPPSPPAHLVEGATAASVIPPSVPADRDSPGEIPVEAELHGPSQDPAGAEPTPSDVRTLSESETVVEAAGTPSAVDAVFRALAGGRAAQDDLQIPGEQATSASQTVSKEMGLDGQAAGQGAQAPVEGLELETYEVEDTLSEATEAPVAAGLVSERDEEAPTIADGVRSTQTKRMSGLPMESGGETVRMVPPPPVVADAPVVEAASDTSGSKGHLPRSAPDASTVDEHIELDVDLDSLSDVEPQASVEGGAGAVTTVPLEAAADSSMEAREAAGSEMDASIVEPAVAESGGPAPAGAAPPPVPADEKAPPPVPQAPPPVPGEKRAPPPVPSVRNEAPGRAETGPKVVDADSTGRGDVSSVKPPKPQDAVRRKPWYQDFFDDDYLPTLPHETPESTFKEVDFLLSELSLPQEGRVLDLGCGYGRHAVEFVARGFSVVGLDNSLPMLIKAAEYSQMRGVEVEFVQQDMREMSFHEEFDAVYCFGTTFGYFGDDENRDLLKRMNRALKPGGRLVLEVVNRDYLLADLPLRVWWEGDGCLVMDEVDFNYFTSRVEAHRTVVFNEGRQIERNMSIRVYSLHELGIQLFQSDLKVLKITGHLATRGRFFGMHSPHLIVTATKKG